MVNPQARRQGVEQLAQRGCSQRRACRLAGLSRSTARYQPRRQPQEAALRVHLRQLSQRHPAYGCPRITALLRREGSVVNHKRVHRLWKAEGLQLPRRRPRKRRPGPKGEALRKARHANHVWSYDFLEARTAQGNKLRILTVLDEFTRECLAIRVERSIPAARVIDTLEWLALTRGLPEHIRSDNGPEFIARAIRNWLAENQCSTIHIAPGSPWENPYIESFNGKLREECLNRHEFANGWEARQIVAEYRTEYNQRRPHSSLGYLTPAEFAAATPVKPEVDLSPGNQKILSL